MAVFKREHTWGRRSVPRYYVFKHNKHCVHAAVVYSTWHKRNTGGGGAAPCRHGKNLFLSFFLSFFLPGWRRPNSRWGWVFVERTRILSGIQFTRYFIEFIVVETKQFVGSNVLVETWSWRDKPAPSARAGLRETNAERYCIISSKQICHMFLISKCRGDWDLGMCTLWVLWFKRTAVRWRLPEKNVFRPQEKIRIWHCAAVLFKQVPKKCTHNFLALGVCFP